MTWVAVTCSGQFPDLAVGSLWGQGGGGKFGVHLFNPGTEILDGSAARHIAGPLAGPEEDGVGKLSRHGGGLQLVVVGFVEEVVKLQFDIGV